MRPVALNNFMSVKIGIIGGSGLDNPDILVDAIDLKVDTIYGAHSSCLRVGKIGQAEVALLARHDHDHTIPPSQVNYRANVSALKDWGAQYILATTAVGSLRAQIGRGDLVILDQFIDFTRKRTNTFFEKFESGHPEHASLADPFDSDLRRRLIAGCEELNLKFHPVGTVITIEGPRFSTRAESKMFRAWGADVINMTIATEAALTKEAGVPYAAVAMSTDYDCWKEDEPPVTWEAVYEIFRQNADNVTKLLVATIKNIQ